MKVYPHMKLKVFLMEERNKELPGIAEKVQSTRREAQERGLNLLITEGRKVEKSKVTASCRYLEEKFQECSKREGVGLATSVASLRVDLRTRTKQLGAKEKVRRKKCDVSEEIASLRRVI